MLNDLAEAMKALEGKKGPEQEIRPLPGMYFFDGWRVHPTQPISSNLPRTKEAPVQDITHATPSASVEPTRSPEEEARDILATAAKNQAEDGPNTRRAAVRACKCLRAMVNQYGSIIQEVHKTARIHTNEQRHSRVNRAVSPTRRRAPSNISRTDLRVTTLPIHATRPMAPG